MEEIEELVLKSYDSKGVTVCPWKYNKKLNFQIEEVVENDVKKARWKKTIHGWYFWMNWQTANKVNDIMKANNINTAQLEVAINMYGEEPKAEDFLYLNSYDIEGISIYPWKYNENIKAEMEQVIDKKRDYSKAHWVKTASGWIFWMNWEVAEIVNTIMEHYMVNTDQLEFALSIHNEQPETLALKGITLLLYYKHGGWITMTFNSMTKVDVSSINHAYYKWIREDDNAQYVFWYRANQLDALIPVLREQQFDVDELSFFNDDFKAGNYAVEDTDQEPSGYTRYVPVSMPEASGVYPLADYEAMNLPFTPYQFQVDDARKMLQYKKLLLANEMGTGKSKICALVGESLPMAKLVVCPASLRLNWKAELLSVNPDADISIVYSDKPAVKGRDWTIIGYPSITKYLDWILSNNFMAVFFDEAHYVKAVDDYGFPASQRAKAAINISKQAEYCFPITGTPKANNNKDLFNLLRLINHPMAQNPNDFRQYGMTYCGAKKDNFGWHFDGNSNDTELNRRIVPYMIRHLRKEVLPHLTKQRIIFHCEADLKEYRKAMDEFEYMKSISSGDPNDKRALAALMTARMQLAIAKSVASIDLAENILSHGEKVVFVTCFLEAINYAMLKFGERAVKITGEMTDEQKQASVDAFQKGNAEVIVMQIKAGGVGITLTKAHYMIFNDMDWGLGNVTQAEDRICRAGQEQLCIIYYTICDSAGLDRQLASSLTRKSTTQNAAIDNRKNEEIDYTELIEGGHQ